MVLVIVLALALALACLSTAFGLTSTMPRAFCISLKISPDEVRVELLLSASSS